MSAVRTVGVVAGVVALVAAGALVATVAGGGGGDDTANGMLPVGDLGQLAGPAWVVINDGSAPAPVVGTVRLEVSPDGRVVAATGCNTVRGTGVLEDGRLVMGPLMSTRMGCEPALMEQERWVTAMLASRPRLEIGGPYLALHWGEGEQWWLGLEREGWRAGATVPATG